MHDSNRFMQISPVFIPACLLLGLGLPEQAMGWLPLTFKIGIIYSIEDKPTEFVYYGFHTSMIGLT
jgi:hypothetical protein